MRKSNGYSIMNILTIGTTVQADKKRRFASTWIGITLGLQLAHIIVRLLGWRYPMILGTPAIIVCWLGVVITQVRDLIRVKSIDLFSDQNHLPLIMSSLTHSIRLFCDKSHRQEPIPVFKEKYHCKEVIHDGRKAYKLTGRPSDEMAAFIKKACPGVGLLVFSVRKINVMYVVNTESPDPWDTLLEKCEKEKLVHIKKTGIRGEAISH